MTRLFLIISSLTVISFTSCQTKSYTCICNGGLSGQGITVVMEERSKSDAESKCEAHNSEPGTADGYTGCHIAM